MSDIPRTSDGKCAVTASDDWMIERINQLERDLAASSNERDELKRLTSFTYCAYCGTEFPIDGRTGSAEVSKHIAVCEKHPMREAEKLLAAANAKIAAQSERIRYLEGATNHATGTPLAKANAMLAAVNARCERYRKALWSIRDADSIWAAEHVADAALQEPAANVRKEPCSSTSTTGPTTPSAKP